MTSKGDQAFEDLLAFISEDAKDKAQEHGTENSGLSEADHKLYDPIAAECFVGPKQEPKFWLFVKGVCEAKGEKCTTAWKQMMLRETCKGFYADCEGSDTGRMVTQLYLVGLEEMRKGAENDEYNMRCVLRTKEVDLEADYPVMFELEEKLRAKYKYSTAAET